MDVAVIGCVVNGPGEAREATLGVAGGYPNSVYVDGEIKHKSHNAELVDTLEGLVRARLKNKQPAADAQDGEDADGQGA